MAATERVAPELVDADATRRRRGPTTSPAGRSGRGGRAPGCRARATSSAAPSSRRSAGATSSRAGPRRSPPIWVAIETSGSTASTRMSQCSAYGSGDWMVQRARRPGVQAVGVELPEPRPPRHVVVGPLQDGPQLGGRHREGPDAVEAERRRHGPHPRASPGRPQSAAPRPDPQHGGQGAASRSGRAPARASGSDLGWGGDRDRGGVDEHQCGRPARGRAPSAPSMPAADVEAAEVRHRVRLRAQRALDHPDQAAVADHDHRPR